MKKLVYLFSSSLIILTFSCKNDDDKVPHQDGCVITVPCGEPEGLISVAEAKTMEDEYKDVFYSLYNEGTFPEYPGYDGAVRDIWFDLDEIKRYIVYVENYAQANGHQDLGLRVYLGAKNQVGQDGENYPRQTIFFVPTARDNSGTAPDDKNLLGAARLNYGHSGIPDSRDSDIGIN